MKESPPRPLSLPNGFTSLGEGRRITNENLRTVKDSLPLKITSTLRVEMQVLGTGGPHLWA